MGEVPNKSRANLQNIFETPIQNSQIQKLLEKKEANLTTDKECWMIFFDHESHEWHEFCWSVNGCTMQHELNEWAREAQKSYKSFLII